MRIFKLYIITIMAMLFNVKYGEAQLPPNDPSYELKFSDDFNGNTLDTANWNQIMPWNQSSNKTDVSYCLYSSSTTDVAYRKWYQTYPNAYPPDSTNCKINSGSLHLYSRKENYSGVVWDWPSGTFTVDTIPFKYTTGQLISKKKFRYGYFEIKFKLPPNPASADSLQGFGPNFWLWNANPPANLSSEIDVFEIDAYNRHTGLNNLITNNIHYQSVPGPINHFQQGYDYGYISANTWHTAGALWAPEKIEFYLDGVMIRKNVNPNIPVDSLIAMPMIIDINSPSTNFCDTFNLKTIFPYVYEVDYVKVWQMKQDCNTALSFCNSFNSATYNSKLYKSVSMSGSGCTDGVSNTSSISFLGTDYVQFNEGWSIDNNSNVYIDVLKCQSDQYFGRMPSLPVTPTIPSPPPPSFLLRNKYSPYHE